MVDHRPDLISGRDLPEFVLDFLLEIITWHGKHQTDLLADGRVAFLVANTTECSMGRDDRNLNRHPAYGCMLSHRLNCSLDRRMDIVNRL